MERDKPYRLQKEQKYEKKEQQNTWLQEQREIKQSESAINKLQSPQPR